MDVERTIEFILQMQAKNDAQIEKLIAKDARLDRRIDGIGKLLKIGMRELMKVGKAQARTEATVERLAIKVDELADAQNRTEQRLEELAAGQKKTDASLRAFIDSMRKGGNGRSRNGG